MSDKLSPKDFASITEWAKQYIIGNIKGELLDPVIAVKSNTHTELIYTVNNPNEVDAYFNDELISAKGQSEMTHIWSEDKFTISGALKAKSYKSSSVVSLEVERAPKLYNITISDTTGGTITCNKTQASAGDIITITCTSDSGYALEALTVNGTSIFVSGTTTYTYTMKEEDIVIAGSYKTNKLILTENDISYTSDFFSTITIKNQNDIEVNCNVLLYNSSSKVAFDSTNGNIAAYGTFSYKTSAVGVLEWVVVKLSADGYESVMVTK